MLPFFTRHTPIIHLDESEFTKNLLRAILTQLTDFAYKKYGAVATKGHDATNVTPFLNITLNET